MLVALCGVVKFVLPLVLPMMAILAKKEGEQCRWELYETVEGEGRSEES